MEKQFKQSSGISLLVGCVLLILTMVLHPLGGSIEHILKIKKVIMISHSIALSCLPFIGFGFWGLSTLVQTKSRLSSLSFFIAAMALVAAMIAGTINGLTLPLFVSEASYASTDPATMKAIVTYGKYINIPMDYIFIAAISFSIGLWSLLIIRTGNLSKWLGYYGLLTIACGFGGILLQFNFVNLFGFRVFIFGMVGWMVAVGLLLIRSAKASK
jgi:hypothetical protein